VNSAERHDVADRFLRAGETGDAALGGAVRIIQPSTGYRFAVDSILLARFAAERPVVRALDLGCGAGVVGLCLLALEGARDVLGIDIQEEMIDRARRATEWNGFGGRARFESGDVRVRPGVLPAGAFELVVSNPPYRPVRSGHVSPVVSTALSRHEIACGLPDVVAAARRALARGGHLCLVFPASRLAALVSAVRAGGVEPKVLRLVHPRAEEPASLVLLRAVKGAKEGLEVRAPLFLHDRAGRYSREAEQLLGSPGNA
jgi:tRNA1(Val) A37 N6-methylase TrmN6